MTPTPTEAPHGIWETAFIPVKGGRPYKDGRYVIQCKCCYAESPAHRPDCEFAALRTRLEEAEKDRRWLVDYAHRGPWATINDQKEFDRIAALSQTKEVTNNE